MQFPIINNKKKFKVITLCGSSRFKKEFIEVAEKLSLEGNIVISLGLFGHADNKFDTVITDEIKTMLDEVHKQKIDMSDAIYVINPGGYIGESTRSEIEFAKSLGKEIYYFDTVIEDRNKDEDCDLKITLNELIRENKRLIELLRSIIDVFRSEYRSPSLVESDDDFAYILTEETEMTYEEFNKFYKNKE